GGREPAALPPRTLRRACRDELVVVSVSAGTGGGSQRSRSMPPTSPRMSSPWLTPTSSTLAAPTVFPRRETRSSTTSYASSTTRATSRSSSTTAPSRLDVRAEAARRLQGTATRARAARAGGRRSAGDGETPRAGRGRVSEGCSKSIPARGRDGPYQLRAGGRPSARALELRAAERRGRSGRGARALDGPRIIRRRGGDGCGRPASAGGIVLRRYDRSGSDTLSGTISE